MSEQNLYNIIFIPTRNNYELHFKNADGLHEIIISTPLMALPFGVERYKYKDVLNIEFNDSNNSKNMYNTMLQIDNFFMRLSSDKNMMKKMTHETNIYNKIHDKTYKSCVRTNQGHHPLFRTHIKNKKIKSLINERSKLRASSEENLTKPIHGYFKLHLSSLWISKYDYGLTWYVKGCKL
uniref:Uncharacterized protein n=1 Tax=Mimivirus LCMiAC01 TaxID=2506608 RepID=A0A481Z024_9VIRU|nr:MAG: uncharacterized protein LCMiAC01_05350 [Mimivirus LCMiAC01]